MKALVLGFALIGLVQSANATVKWTKPPGEVEVGCVGKLASGESIAFTSDALSITSPVLASGRINELEAPNALKVFNPAQSMGELVGQMQFSSKLSGTVVLKEVSSTKPVIERDLYVGCPGDRNRGVARNLSSKTYDISQSGHYGSQRVTLQCYQNFYSACQ